MTTSAPALQPTIRPAVPKLRRKVNPREQDFKEQDFKEQDNDFFELQERYELEELDRCQTKVPKVRRVHWDHL